MRRRLAGTPGHGGRPTSVFLTGRLMRAAADLRHFLRKPNADQQLRP
jgi:hypothetical protein